jgi:cell division protein FtsB
VKEQDTEQNSKTKNKCSGKTCKTVGRLQDELLFVIVVFMFFIIGRHFLVQPKERQLQQIEYQIHLLKQQKMELEAKCAELRNRINAARYDPFFIEEAARDVLRLVREGEVSLMPPVTVPDKADNGNEHPPSYAAPHSETSPR